MSSQASEIRPTFLDETSYGIYPKIPITSSASAVRKRGEIDQPGDLIAFLAIVHRPSLDISFAKWDVHRSSLGQGATGQVDQSSVNLRANLAFKRATKTRRSRKISDEFKVLISEVLTLTQPSTRYHPQIITLEAVSWEFHPETRDAWPVLLFEKAHHGDLLSFLKSHKGQSLSFEERLRLCKDVALALISLHRFAIIHGDINPKNILVFEDRGTYYAKLADFGYAAPMVRDETIDLAKTWPWSAPEWDNTWLYLFNEARKTDIYSFGVVCLWTCFSPFANREMCLSEGCNLFDTGWIERCRIDRTVVMQAESLIQIAIEAGSGCSKLLSFFQNSLVEHPGARSLDLESLFQGDNLSASYETVEPEFNEATPVPYAALFEVAKIFHAVVEGDFRLWHNIKDALMLQAEDSKNEHCRSNAAFQLSVCFKLGFCCTHSHAESSVWLSRSQKNEQDLLEVIEFIRRDNGPWATGFFADVAPRVQGKMYAEDLVLLDAQNAHQSLMRSLCAELGGQHSRVVIQTVIIAEILLHLQKGAQAAELLEEALNACRSEDASTRYQIQNALRHVYYMTGLVKKERHLVQEIYKSRKARYPNSNLVYLSLNDFHQEEYQRNLIPILYTESKFQQAIDIGSPLIDLTKAMYGEDNDRLVDILMILAACYLRLGHQHEHQIMSTKALDMSTRLFGPMSEATLKARLFAFQDLYQTMSGIKKHGELSFSLLQDCNKVLRNDHYVTVEAMVELSTSYMQQGRSFEARHLVEKALAISQLENGDIHATTLKLKHKMAVLYAKGIRIEEAEELAHEVLQGCSENLGINDSVTMAAQYLLISMQRRERFWRSVSFVIPMPLIVALRRRINELEELVRRLFYWFV